MFISRRQALQHLCNAIPALAVVSSKLDGAPTLLNARTLEPFVDPLPIPGVARSAGVRPHPEKEGKTVEFYRMRMREFTIKVHRDIPAGTWWGFDGTFPGPTIEAHSGRAIQVEWLNELPKQHLFPIDHSLCGAEKDKPDVRAVVHLHGAKVAPESDGYPEHWMIPGQSRTCFYPNAQPNATLFYHDHAMGITRLNAMAGLAGLCLLRDENELALGLPAGRYEIPLVICDRTFTKEGQLFYPSSRVPGNPWVPEFFGDAILVNGKLFPYLEVEPRQYRFRILNAANSGLYYLSLRDGQQFDAKPLSMYQIGSDQGLLSAPAPLQTLELAAGERADLVIDFAGKRNQTLYLRTTNMVIMQFRVSDRAARNDSVLPHTLVKVSRMPEAAAQQVRVLTLDDCQDRNGNSHLMRLNGSRWMDPVTEKPKNGTAEIWTLLNLTEDTHPIHLHNVRFQLLDRQPFDRDTYLLTKNMVTTGKVIAPTEGEAGWKDTVQAYPAAATRIIVPFEGHMGRYVWHCHLLEHEDNEMMRPYEIVP